MEKIPTLFERDPGTNYRYVRNVIHPACQWVLDGEGEATRKYDGICVMFDGSRWWARREVKADRGAPPGFLPIEEDKWTGETVGWAPAQDSGFWKYLFMAIGTGWTFKPGTYELIGPKINQNPEKAPFHHLIAHGDLKLLDVPLEFGALGEWLHAHPFEGIVWWHQDGRRAKIKRKDFPT